LLHFLEAHAAARDGPLVDERVEQRVHRLRSSGVTDRSTTWGSPRCSAGPAARARVAQPSSPRIAIRPGVAFAHGTPGRRVSRSPNRPPTPHAQVA
jgi:hypothetical protein